MVVTIQNDTERGEMDGREVGSLKNDNRVSMEIDEG
jgi:hypothetical protein